MSLAGDTPFICPRFQWGLPLCYPCPSLASLDSSYPQKGLSILILYSLVSWDGSPSNFPSLTTQKPGAGDSRTYRYVGERARQPDRRTHAVGEVRLQRLSISRTLPRAEKGAEDALEGILGLKQSMVMMEKGSLDLKSSWPLPFTCSPCPL